MLYYLVLAFARNLPESHELFCSANSNQLETLVGFAFRRCACLVKINSKWHLIRIRWLITAPPEELQQHLSVSINSGDATFRSIVSV